MDNQIKLDSMKKAVVDYVKFQLGDGMIDIELDPAHYDSAYERAIGVYRQRATNAYEESYAFLELLENQSVYELPDEIQSVRQVFRRTVGNMQGPGSTSFDPFSSSTLNTYLLNYNKSGGLATYEFYTQYVEMAAKMFGGFMNYTFNQASNKISFVRNPVGSGETVLLWTFNLRPEIQLLKDSGSSQWIKDYMMGNCKVMIGEAREKFATIAGPQGGTALNGAAMKAEGLAMMDNKIEELKNYVDGSAPLTWVIG